MCRRRLFKSNFYINYGGTKKAHGETVIVSPFVAGGGESTFELHSRNPWAITNTLSWLTVSSLSDKSGTYIISLTALQNPYTTGREGSFVVKTLDGRYTITVTVSQVENPGETYIFISPDTVNMEAVDTYNKLRCYLHHNNVDTEITPSWTSSDYNLVLIDNNGALTSNNVTPVPSYATITATYVHDGTTLSATSIVNVAAAEIREWLELSPDNISISYGDSQTLTVTLVQSVNNVETRTEITDLSQLTFTLSDVDSAAMNGFDLVNQNITDENVDEEIYVVYGTLTSNTITATMVKPESIEHLLTVKAIPPQTTYSGTSYLYASSVTLVNGTIVSCEEVTNVRWSENNTAITISNNVITAQHTGNTAITVPISGYSESLGLSGTTSLIVNARPAASFRISRDSVSTVSSAAGECNFYISWAYLKPGTVITFDDDNLLSYLPESIEINSTNYKNGEITVVGQYSENTSLNQRDLYLRGTATTLYDEEKTDYYWYVQDGKEQTITYELVVSPTSARLNYGESTGLTVTYYVVTDGVRDGGTDVTNSATYTNTGSNRTAITVNSNGVITGNNTGTTDKAVTLNVSYGLATPVDVVITSIHEPQYTYGEIYFNSGADRYDYDLPSVTISATGSKNNIHVYQRVYVDGSFSGWYNDTENASYTVYSGQTQLGSFTCGSSGEKYNDDNITISYTSSGGIQISCSNGHEEVLHYSIVADEGSYDDTLEITVEAAQIERVINVSVNGKVSSNAGGTCTNYIVSWTGLTVGSIIDMTADNASLAQYEIEVTAATGSVTIENSPMIFENAGSSRSIRVVGEWRPNTAITGSDQWSQQGGYVPPVATYSVTFISRTGGSQTTASYIEYSTTSGSKSGNRSGVSQWTVSGFTDGETIEYTGQKTGYYDVTGSETINGEDLTIYIDFQEIPTSPVIVYLDKDTNDSRTYTIVTTLSTTDGAWSKSVTGTTNSVNNTTKAVTIDVPATQTGKTFTFSFLQLTSTAFDELSFGGHSVSPVTADTFSALNESIGDYSFRNIDYTTFKVSVSYAHTGNITLDCSNATNYESVSILLNGNTIVTSTVPEPQSGTFAYTSTAQTFEIGMGSALGDGNRYKRFAVRIEDKNGNTLYDDTCRYLYPNSNPDYAGRTLTAAQLNGSVWHLYNLSNWGDIAIYPASPQTGVSGSTVSGNRSSVTIQINWSGLSNGTMTVSLPDNMTYGGSNTITIPVSSTNGSVTRLVDMPVNTGSVPTGSDITYTIRVTATDVNSDTISGGGTIIHQYYYYSAPTIQLMESPSFIPLSTSYANVHWGQLPNEDLEINIQCNDCSEIYISWDSELEFNMFNLTNATDSSGHDYVENDQTFYPIYPGGMVTLLSDVSKQISEASQSSCQGYLRFQGKNSYGDITTIEIYFTP